MEIVEPSEYLKNPRKCNFVSLIQCLIFSLVPNESLIGRNRKSRPAPFDTYCQSMQKDIDKCVCNECGLYWP